METRNKVLSRFRWQRPFVGLVVVATLLFEFGVSSAAGGEPTCEEVIAATRITVGVHLGPGFILDDEILATYDEDSTGDPLSVGTNYDWQVAGCPQNQTSGYLSFNAIIDGGSIGDCADESKTPTVYWSVVGGTGSGSHSNSGPGTGNATLHNDPANGDKLKVGEQINLRVADCNGNTCGTTTFTITQGCQ